MMDFAMRLSSCRTRIREVYASLNRQRDEISDVDIGQEPDRLGWNFRIRFRDTDYSLSIAVPPDMMAGYCETALLSGGNLVYRSEWGYMDVARFGDIEELVREIKRIGRLAQSDGKEP
jgi:hypothetical protein